MKKHYTLFFSLFFLGIETSDAQLTTLLNFNGTNGHAPKGSLTLVGSRFYGMTDSGGASNIGCIFSIDTNGNNYKDILDFSGVNGQGPLGTLTFSNGLLYGMTSQGGVFGEGNIFSIDTDGAKYDNLFDIYGLNGEVPSGDVLVSGSVKIFGMTEYGGTYGYGVIFSMDTSGWGYKVLFSFNDTDGGNSWNSSLVMIGHRLYGVTNKGMYDDTGVIFSIDTNGSGYKILKDTAYTLVGGLTLSGNKFYGLEAGFSGGIFSIDTNGQEFKNIFSFNERNGSDPEESHLTLSGNRLYGTTGLGGKRYVNFYGYYGVVFSIDTNGYGFKDLFKFDGTDGGYSWGGVIVSGNKVYGMTSYGGTDTMGIIFSIDTSARSTTSIDEVIQTKGVINIFPNPNKGQFTVVCNRAITVGSQPVIEIYNILGEKIYSANLVDGNTTINLGEPPKGVYIYRILTSGSNLVNPGKLVIE